MFWLLCSDLSLLFNVNSSKPGELRALLAIQYHFWEVKKKKKKNTPSSEWKKTSVRNHDLKSVAQAGFLAIFTPWTRQARARHNFTSLHSNPRNTILLDFGSLTLPYTVPFLNRTLEFAELNPNPDFYEFERQKEKRCCVWGWRWAGGSVYTRVVCFDLFFNNSLSSDYNTQHCGCESMVSKGLILKLTTEFRVHQSIFHWGVLSSDAHILVLDVLSAWIRKR